MNQPMDIKVGILISYDYEYVYKCIEQIYQNATIIVLAIDKKRRTWKGDNYDLCDDFFVKIKEMDSEGKISIYEDDFYDPNLNVIQCDTSERNRLAQFMGVGGWHIQIDSDEYFIDFPRFVTYLRSIEYRGIDRKLVIYARWLTLFKKSMTGYFYIENSIEMFPVATNSPNYDVARVINDKSFKCIYTNFLAIHESWARPEAELQQKLNNWSHSSDFIVNDYLEFWRSISIYNYKYISNFHPMYHNSWPQIGYIAGELGSVLDFAKQRSGHPREIQKRELYNNRSLLYLVSPPIIVIILNKFLKIISYFKK